MAKQTVSWFPWATGHSTDKAERQKASVGACVWGAGNDKEGAAHVGWSVTPSQEQGMAAAFCAYLRRGVSHEAAAKAAAAQTRRYSMAFLNSFPLFLATRPKGQRDKVQTRAGRQPSVLWSGERTSRKHALDERANQGLTPLHTPPHPLHTPSTPSASFCRQHTYGPPIHRGTVGLLQNQLRRQVVRGACHCGPVRRCTPKVMLLTETYNGHSFRGFVCTCFALRTRCAHPPRHRLASPCRASMGAEAVCRCCTGSRGIQNASSRFPFIWWALETALG